MWAHKEGRQPEHKAIEHGEIRRTLSGAIADQELMFEQERFSYDLARSARAEAFREGHEQMDRQEEQIAHELETILPATLHKTAPRRQFMPNLPIRHHRRRCASIPAFSAKAYPSRASKCQEGQPHK
jgi:hypothetical protein